MILIDEETKVIVQNMTGRQGSFHSKIMLEYGTKIIAGTSKSRKQEELHGIPIYNSVQEASNEHDFDASIIFVPAPFCKDALMEAIDSEVPLIVVIT
ncbi:MAG: succinate--CoA ligase subunit alpha, partial [Candidatus Helarchaeales archaeon]